MSGLKPGKKTRAWEACRRKLKVLFERAGITTCEMRRARCCYDNFLGFAHLHKRRNVPPEELETVVLLCVECHRKVETLPEAVMAKKLADIIAARPVQP